MTDLDFTLFACGTTCTGLFVLLKLNMYGKKRHAVEDTDSEDRDSVCEGLIGDDVDTTEGGSGSADQPDVVGRPIIV